VDAGAGLLLLAPVEDEFLAFELAQQRFAVAKEHTVSELSTNVVAEAQRFGQTTSLDDAAATVLQELSQ
jgi:hypothetical protein